MDDAADLALHAWGDGDDQAAVAQRGSDVLIDQALGLSRPQDGVERAGDGSLHARQFAAYLVELGRGGVADVAKLIDDLVGLLDQDGEGSHAVGKPVEGLIVLLGDVAVLVQLLVEAADEGHEAVDGVEGAAEVEELLHLEVGVLQADALQGGAHVEEEGQRHVGVLLAQAPKLAHLFQPFVDGRRVLAKRHLIDKQLAQRRQTTLLEQEADVVDADLPFVVVGIYHL